MQTNTRTQRSGFALPVVILAMFILVGALASGFVMLRGENAASDAALQAQSATAIAEAGLQQAMSNRAGLGLAALPGATPDSARLVVSGGYADIVTTRLRVPTETVPGIYYIRVTGVRTQSGVSGAGDAVATAASFGTYKPITMTVQSSMTGINGIRKSGSSGLISGHDVCGQKASLPAVSVPLNPGITGSGQWQNSLEGSQKVDTLAATQQAAADSVPIDWDAIVNDDAITPDFDVTAAGVGFPNTAWFDNNPSSWPTIIVRNGPDPSTEFALPNFGRGLLIIFGDLNLNGNHAGWNGIVLVGGRLRSNGQNEVNGATITGLNTKLGFNVEDNEVNELQGTKQFKYHSCNVASALNGGGIGGLKPYQSTWANSFPMY